MHQIMINDQYLIHKPIFESQGIIIYRGLVKKEMAIQYYNIHCIHNKKLIKYYLTKLGNFTPTLPLEDYFIQDSNLYMVFSSKENGTPIHHSSFSATEKKGFLLSVLAQLALDIHLPNFIKSQLLNSESLLIDRNHILHMDVKLTLLNPDQFDDFQSVQTKIADLATEIFEPDDQDNGLKIFIKKCEEGDYQDYMALLTDYKTLINISNETNEPWLYAMLYQWYQKLKRYRRRIIVLGLILLFVYYGVQRFSASEASLTAPYQKTNIGSTQYDDPYSQPLEKEEQINISKPFAVTTPAAPSPTSDNNPENTTSPGPTADNIHTVKPGDFLVKISKEAYGDGKYAWALAKYNNIKNPSLLYKGTPLKIPPLKTIQEIFSSMQGKK